jgi:arginyl-tRNA synthetase
VRCCGILDKLGKPGKPDPALLKSAHEAALVKKLAEYPNILRQAAASYNPAVIAQYLIELSHVFSAFYENCPVLKAETPELKASRAALISAFRAVLASGLGLLGIQAPEAM